MPVGLAPHGGAHFVDEAARVAGEGADPGLAAQCIFQDQQHGDVLKIIVHGLLRKAFQKVTKERVREKQRKLGKSRSSIKYDEMCLMCEALKL